MDFNAQQMRADALIQEGRYKFVVKDAREKRSAAGNDMLNLKLGIKIALMLLFTQVLRVIRQLNIDCAVG